VHAKIHEGVGHVAKALVAGSGGESRHERVPLGLVEAEGSEEGDRGSYIGLQVRSYNGLQVRPVVASASAAAASSAASSSTYFSTVALAPAWRRGGGCCQRWALQRRGRLLARAYEASHLEYPLQILI
jgi:hypothetical protein